jgi:hypothetical protein
MMNAQALYPENRYFDDPKLANEIVKAVFSVKRTIRPLIGDHVEDAYRFIEKKPTQEEVIKTIDRCVELGMFREDGEYIHPASRERLYKSLGRTMESYVYVYSVPLDAKKAVALAESMSKNLSSYHPHYGHREGKLWIRTEKPLSPWLQRRIRPESEQFMTEEKFFEFAYGMYPLLNLAMIEAGKLERADDFSGRMHNTTSDLSK